MSDAVAAPVLLVPGWSDRPRALGPLRAGLLRAGWPESHVRALGFRDRWGSNVEHASEIGTAAAALLDATGAARLDIVAHSMGGLAVREFLHAARASAPVRRVVFLGTPHRGTLVAWLAWGAGAPEMRPGSEFLGRLAAAPLPAGVETMTIRARLDLRVIPALSACLDRAPDTCVPWVTHRGLLRSSRVRRLVIDALRR
jgi:triacylglycerol lipase